MREIWSDEKRFSIWLEIETLICEAMAQLGQIPESDARAIRERARFSTAEILEIEKRTHHDVIAFLENVSASIGPEARWMHQGLTSSDILDTSLAVQLCLAVDILLEDIRDLKREIALKAREYKYTPMIGRSHGVHAEPITFGLKMALMYEEFGRAEQRMHAARTEIAVGKLSGAVGTHAHLDPEVESIVCAKLGLDPDKLSTQIIQRDRHAAFSAHLAVVASSIDRWATEFRHLQRTEVLELEEYFSPGQKGSSAMPHKRNPIGCEQIVGLARLLRSNCHAAFENIALWHERDISHSSVERVILPDTFIALDHMLRRFTRIVTGMVVYPDRMRKNLERSRGVVFSGTVLLELARRGISREQAYEWVQRNAMRSFSEQRDFKALLLADPDVTGALSRAEIDRAFNLDEQFRHVDEIFERVFDRVPSPV